MARSHRVRLTEPRASRKAGDAARMGTELPSKREGSRSGSGSRAFSLPRWRTDRATVRDHGREPAVPIATSSLAERRAILRSSSDVEP